MASASGISPFLWNSKGEPVTKAQLERDRRIAAAMHPGTDYQPTGPWGLLGGLAREGVSAYQTSELDKKEKAATDAAAEQWAGLGDGYDDAELMGLVGNEFANPAQSAVAQALMQRGWSKADRDEQWAHEDAKPDWQTFESGGDVYRYNRNDPSSKPETFFDGPQASGFRPMTSEEKAAYGLPPDSAAQIGPDGKVDTIGGGGVNVDVNNMGSIPPGYAVEYDEAGNPVKMNAVPGSPAYLDEQDKIAEKNALAEKAAVGEGRRDTNTDTIVGAASIARDLAAKPGNAGVVGAVMSALSETDAAEMRRQVSVLTANATIENLTAMRQASPTGGALGSVTEKEGAMLAAAAGAIDPNAKPADFVRALDNYERTLLRIIHGPAEGDRIFEETRKVKDDEDVDSILQGYGL